MRSLLISVTAAALLPAAAHAADQRLGQIEIAAPWSRPALAGMNGAGFMTVTNKGAKADALVAVQSPIAKKVELHRSDMTGGIMRMQRQERLALPAGGAVKLAPGGDHLMLIGLAKPLKAGDRFPATLVFASGARQKVEFTVQGAAPTADAHTHHH